jgi:hypothetical protein
MLPYCFVKSKDLTPWSNELLGGERFSDQTSSVQTCSEGQKQLTHDLVGGLEHFLFFHRLGIIIPTDFHIFQRGRSTTNQWPYQNLYQNLYRSPVAVSVGWGQPGLCIACPTCWTKSLESSRCGVYVWVSAHFDGRRPSFLNCFNDGLGFWDLERPLIVNPG